MVSRQSKSTAKGSAKKTQPVVPASIKEAFEGHYKKVEPLGRAAVAAQAKAERHAFEGTPQTQTALAAIYSWGESLRAVSPDVFKRLLKGRTYQEPNPHKPGQLRVKEVPFGKPAKENYFVALVKLGLPGASKALLSKAATVLKEAQTKGKTPDEFPDWLAKEHSHDGKSYGAGLTGAYRCILAGRATPPADDEEASSEEPDDGDLAALRDAALKNRRQKVIDAKDWPLEEDPDFRIADVGVTLDVQDGASITLLPLRLPHDLMRQLLEIASVQAEGTDDAPVVEHPRQATA